MLEPIQINNADLSVKLPKILHRRLTLEAQQEGVSLNILVLYKLAL